jgi:hypothetical protein
MHTNFRKYAAEHDIAEAEALQQIWKPSSTSSWKKGVEIYAKP